MKLPSWPKIFPEQVEAATAVLESGRINYWTGPEGKTFEDEFSKYLSCERSIMVANGSLALELALRALGIGHGDEVVVTPRSFMASVSCVSICGARPVFADVDAESGNLTAQSIEAVLTPKTKAVIPVHLAGWPCEMDEIMTLAESRGIKVIEDCAQAHGATYRGNHAGTIGHAGAWSFCQDKIMTTGGEGGMLTTNDGELWARAWAYKDHGKDFDTVFNKQHPPGFRWLHESFGTNWRMTEMQSAIGRVALKMLPDWTATRRGFAATYDACFRDLPALRVVNTPEYSEHAYYRYFVYVVPEALKPDWNRDRIIQELCACGVPGHVGTCSEIYLEKAFDHDGLRPAERLPVARQLGDESLMFPVHPELNQEHVDWICGIVKDVVSEATR